MHVFCITKMLQASSLGWSLHQFSDFPCASPTWRLETVTACCGPLVLLSPVNPPGEWHATPQLAGILDAPSTVGTETLLLLEAQAETLGNLGKLPCCKYKHARCLVRKVASAGSIGASISRACPSAMRRRRLFCAAMTTRLRAEDIGALSPSAVAFRQALQLQECADI